MAANKEHLWQAHIDGHLSAAEASEFEASLSPEERELLAADARFERRLGESLGQPLPCPDAVWHCAIAKLPAENTEALPARAVGSRRWLFGGLTLAAAAAVAFMISLGVTPQGAPSIVLAADSVEELKAQAKTPPSLDAVQAFLEDHGVDVEIVLHLDHFYQVSFEGHGMEFLGAGTETFGNQEVAELFFDCCNHPAKLIIAQRGSAAAKAVSGALGRHGDVQVVRDAGGYVIAVVGKHQAHDLIDTVYVPH